MTTIKDSVAAWSETRRDEFEERAAIRQWESGAAVTRQQAELSAFIEISRLIKREVRARG